MVFRIIHCKWFPYYHPGQLKWNPPWILWGIPRSDWAPNPNNPAPLLQLQGTTSMSHFTRTYQAGRLGRQNSKRQFLTDSLIGSWEDPFISWLTIHPYISGLYFIPYKKHGITTRWFNSLPFYIPVGGHQQPLTVTFNHPKKVTIAELPGSYFLNKM